MTVVEGHICKYSCITRADFVISNSLVYHDLIFSIETMPPKPDTFQCWCKGAIAAGATPEETVTPSFNNHSPSLLPPAMTSSVDCR